jgi:hypothetical protein
MKIKNILCKIKDDNKMIHDLNEKGMNILGDRKIENKQLCL